jgi:hypothetical protein
VAYLVALLLIRLIQSSVRGGMAWLLEEIEVADGGGAASSAASSARAPWWRLPGWEQAIHRLAYMLH